MKELGRSIMGKRGWIVLAVLLAYLAGVFSEQQGFLKFVRKHPMEIWRLLLQHLQLVGISGAVAVGIGVPSAFS